MDLLRIISKTISIVLCIAAFHSFNAFAEPGRIESELSGPGWRLWLDKQADWKNDTVFMPPVNLSSLPVNPPTCGWDKLAGIADTTASVPGTVEEYFWSRNGNPWGEAGDYRGVSWWSKTFNVDNSMKGKNITIAFDSVVLRAEVFVNNKLVGYDVIGNTPFEVDITGAVKFGVDNSLDIRITDPVGNFDWNNNELYKWGKNLVPAYHGFGGITGKIYLRATDNVRIDDIYVQNKPKVKEAEIFVTLANFSGGEQKGNLSVVIHEWKDPSKILWKNSASVRVSSDSKVLSVYAKVPKAELWNIRDPHLYMANVTFSGDDGKILDSAEKRFGFRWFDIVKKDGDEKFYLNGKRVFVLGPMQRGFWPKNGMFPTPEMAKRNSELLLKLGFNAFIMNQCMAQPYAADSCDEYGILSHDDPGGYRCDDKPDAQAAVWRREKLRRLIIRDRSKPSNYMTMLKDETRTPPSEDDISNMKMAHSLDPSRILVYNSDFDRSKKDTEYYGENPFKLHMRPFDQNLHYYGWWNSHHFIQTAGWQDEYYKNPRLYIRGQAAQDDSVHLYDPGEIVYLGEEGAFGATVRIQKIKEELDKTGSDGWREKQYLDLYDAYDSFLDDSGFRKSFPTVDDLTLALGKNLHYFHGRAVENCRMGNIVDGYVLNAWAAESSHTDFVDQYRNPTADPSIFAHYTQPLYVAVKIRQKVLPVGSSSIADFFIVNELDLKGARTLEIKLSGPDGSVVMTKDFNVMIKGGDTYGQLLIEGVDLPTLDKPGYYKLNAAIKNKDKTEATGFDDIYVADFMSGAGFKGSCAVVDTAGTVNTFLKKTRGITLPEFDPNGPDLDMIIIGSHDFRKTGRAYNAIMEKVDNGATLIILDQADKWAQRMDDRCLRYTNRLDWGDEGRLFVGKSSYLEGLPQAMSMDWEYQTFYAGRPWALNLDFLGVEPIVCFASTGRKEIGCALSRIKFGTGQIFLSTLNILPELSSDKPESTVAKRLFMNLVDSEANLAGK